MMKKTIVTMMLMAVCCSLSFAQTCPTLNDIKANKLDGWKAYDSDDGTPLSSIREIDFKKSIEAFALAEWSKDQQKKSSIHCYYHDSTGSGLEAYLAKENFIPNNANHAWYEVSGFMHCAAGMDKCQFKTHVLPTTARLARR